MDVGPDKSYILQFLSAAFANSDEIERRLFDRKNLDALIKGLLRKSARHVLRFGALTGITCEAS